MKSSDDPNQQYLGLTGIIMRLEYAESAFTAALNEIKQATFGRNDFSLHRADILAAAKAPYTVLKDPAVREAFDNALITLIEDATYRVVTVIIDKKEHRDKYKVWRYQPYHYCMAVLLERYVLFLEATKDSGDVMVESRQKKDNKRLSKAYRRLYKHGTEHISSARFQAALTSTEIKIKTKTDNIAGLQLADIVANPSCRELICKHTKVEMTAEFSRRVVDILYRKKYRRGTTGVAGFGTKWLP
jgi:hypothetical protein